MNEVEALLKEILRTLEEIELLLRQNLERVDAGQARLGRMLRVAALIASDLPTEDD